MTDAPRRGRRKDARGRYLIHVLESTSNTTQSACGSLEAAPSERYSDQEPNHNHPLCQPCLRATARTTTVRPVVVRTATPPPPPAAPATLPLEAVHYMVWAAHALGSANRLAIVQALQTGPAKLEALRERVEQWEGMFDLSMHALTRGRIVHVEGKRAHLTDLGRILFEQLRSLCAAGVPREPAAPTH